MTHPISPKVPAQKTLHLARAEGCEDCFHITEMWERQSRSIAELQAKLVEAEKQIRRLRRATE